MKIQSKLVFDKHSNELIGFVDLCVARDLKYTIAYFLTKNVSSYQIMPMFWKAVSVLELVCNLWVCAAVSDGASPNLYADLMDPGSEDLVHYTTNLFAPSRKIYFFSDASHLLKTARNCLFSSGSGKRTRYLWNDVEPQSIEGNVSRRHSGKRMKWSNVSEEPLPKKKTFYLR